MVMPTLNHHQALKADYPWTHAPMVVAAPMRLISTAPLAVAVTQAGGLGFIGAGTDLGMLELELSSATSFITTCPVDNCPAGILPIGVGVICWGAELQIAIDVIKRAALKPAVLWLFAPRKPQDLVTWTEKIREASGNRTRIWIQVGTVSMALEASKTCKPDALVIQGADAGGHGLERSGSIVTLVPECTDALAHEGYGHIPLIAAGGIMDGRGVAAALFLGAAGVCLGTRFLATVEANISKGYQSAVVKSSDGGISTARTTIYDRLRETLGWPEDYNARGILNESFFDNERGMNEEENKKLYQQAKEMGDAGWGDKGRMTTYAGTGVGLTQKVVPAGDVVKEILRNSRLYLQQASKVKL